MNWFYSLMKRFPPPPAHTTQERGQQGESVARRELEQKGLKFLCANFRGRKGEIDLVFRTQDTLIFVEVKSRESASWTRPAAAVDRPKRLRLSRTALEYLRACGNPEVRLRFDIVEVLTQQGVVSDIRHIEDAFELAAPYRYG